MGELKKIRKPKIESTPLFALLTNRELEVLLLLLDGKTNKAIAKDLFITESAVKKHVTSIFLKTETNSRNELFAKIIKELIF